MDDPRVAAAREWIELGALIVVANGKNPGAFLGDDWPSKATVDVDLVRGWIARWPEANIGVVPGDAVLLVDVDDPARLAELEQQLGPVPPTPRYLTGGAPGRERIVFRHPGVKLRKMAFGAGIEVRTGNLMSVVPPGRNPDTGNPVEWRTRLDEEPLHPLAQGWLVHAGRNGDSPDVPVEMPEKIPHGAQHHHLVSIAGTFRKRGLSEPEIAAALKEVNRLRCERPGSDREMERIARSVVENYDAELDAVLATTVVKKRERDSPRFSIRPLDENRMRSPRFLFEDRIVVGVLNMITGSGGVGKGTFAAWMMAGLSLGELRGDFEGEPVNSLIVGDEDDFDEVWTPRIVAASGDVSHVFGLHYDSGTPLDLVRDIGMLESLVLERDIQLLFLDQVLDHLSPDLNANLPKDVRSGLAPVRHLARRHDVTVVYAGHPRKGGGEASLRDRTGGSHQFTDLARSGLILGYHPEDRDRRALARGKGNMGPLPPALVFEIETSFVTNPATRETVEVPLVSGVEAEHGLRAEDVYVDPPKEHGPLKVDLALEVLRGLGEDGQWRTRKAAEKACRALEISVSTFARAFTELEKETRRAGMEVEWRLREGEHDAED